MQVQIHHGSPVPELINNQLESADPRPNEDHSRLCIVGGALSRERLKKRLARDGHPPTNVAQFTTVDDISEAVLEGGLDPTPVLLPESFTQRLIQETLRRARDGEFSSPVRQLAQGLPSDEDNVVETLYQELNEYYRCTDACNDHRDLSDLAADLENTYACESGQRRLEQFAELTDVLETLAAELTEEAIDTNTTGDSIVPYISRSHFVSAAREHIQHQFHEVFGEVSWVGITTISVFDNPTLRLLLEIGRHHDDVDLHFFLGAGSYERQRKRLTNISTVDVQEADDERNFSSSSAKFLSDALDGEHESEVPPNLELVEAPERRREVEFLAQDVRGKLNEGYEPRDIVVVARNIEAYATPIQDIFESNGLPYHLETKAALAHAPSYRFLVATFDLIQAAVDNEEIGYDTLVDPLRLGFCHPKEQPRYWPLQDRVFLYLEQRLHDAEERDGKRTFGEWQRTVADLTGWDEPRERMEAFLDWISDQQGSPPQTGEQLRDIVRRLVSDYIYQMVPNRRSRPDGPGIDATRSRLTDQHTTAVAQNVYNSAAQVGQHYEYLQEVFDDDADWTASWEEASQALFDVLGGGTIRQQQKDGNAIRIVDAGDTFFMDAEHVHLLGLSRGDFPVEREEATFLHENLRERVASESEEGTLPYFRLAAQETQYKVDIDYYELALQVSSESITVSHQFRDTEANEVPWSAFLDLIETDPSEDYVTRVRADQWLPEPGTTGMADTWDELGSQISERDRQRLIQHHANRAWPGRTAPEITADNLERLSTLTNQETYTQQVRPRYERYVQPPTQITVSADEAAFDGFSLQDIVGSPISVHELDLFSQCQLKFYYYQFLFNFNGTDVRRQEIPFYMGSRQNYRFGQLPQIIQHHYAGEQSREAWQSIINQKLRDRRSLTDRFDSRDEVREWVQEEFNSYIDLQIGPQLADEYTLVEQEEESDETHQRQWTWQQERRVDVGNETRVWLPGHRQDILPHDDDYVLPIYHVRHSSYAQKASKTCWNGSRYRDEGCSSLCESCDDVDDCSYNTRFMLDHRIHTLPHAEDNYAGYLFHDQYESGSHARHGLIKQNHAAAIRAGINNGPEANLGPGNQIPTAGWYSREGQWNEDLNTHLENIQPTDGEVEFSVGEGFVNRGGCESCAYRSMCGVPDGGEF
ncbi:hypothetical protein [Haloarcula amylolytica]|uniref:hypothetical protein n=1 Tax=Haloarcula amylolytica TaxID=396317 RepID=UPI003C732F32